MAYVLSQLESNAVFELAEKLTGTYQRGTHRRDVLLQNVCRRITATNAGSLAKYLAIVEANNAEYQELLSALTIHTTSWFREESHFQKTWTELANARKYSVSEPLMVFSAACSTGKEVYSFALMLEEIRSVNPSFDYKIVGMDLDPVSIKTASGAIYPKEESSTIPAKYQSYLRFGNGEAVNFFTLNKEIRKRCSFQTGDLRTVSTSLQQAGNSSNRKKWDLIICRNVLIYFHKDEVDKIVRVFTENLDSHGILCLGHSEAIDGRGFGLKGLGNAIYRRIVVEQNPLSQKKHLLIVDDSVVIRKIIAKSFRKDGFETHEASSAAEATELMQKHKIDLVTLDLHMPVMDGPTWLKEQRQNGMRIPVVIISDAAPSEASAVLGALEKGAQDYIEKKELHEHPTEVIAKISELIDHERSLHIKNKKSTQSYTASLVACRPELIVIGASTGGTEALTKLLKNFHRTCPPIIVVQHITSNFAKAFATRLAEASGLILGVTQKPELLSNGTIYLSFGDYHLGVKRRRDESLEIYPSDLAPMGRHRPSIDFLFTTTAQAKVQATAVLLTGMGRDGADGLLHLRKSGAQTLAQNQESCVVFGMPREAIEIGAAQFVGDLIQIRTELDKMVTSPGIRQKNSA